jgi:pimeloyl-ACP methyl ester carboxylesterase
MAFATSSDGVRIAYDVVGNGPPLLLHHGFAVSARVWHEPDYVTPLQDRYRLILMDARGHGESDNPHDPADYVMPRRVADVTAVLDALGIDQVHFLGYSMGARVGFAVGTLAPDRIASFILGGSDPFLSAHAAIPVVVVSACFSRCFQRPAL